MTARTDDIRIGEARPLITPWVLAEELPLEDRHAATVATGRRTLEGSERRSQHGGGEGEHVATVERDRSSGGSAGSVKPGDFEWGEVVGEGSYSLVRKVTRATTSHILMGLESVLMPRVDARESTMLANHAAARASIT